MSILWTLAFESPVIAVERVVRNRGSDRNKAISSQEVLVRESSASEQERVGGGDAENGLTDKQPEKELNANA